MNLTDIYRTLQPTAGETHSSQMQLGLSPR
jgi:hypothetical protein